MSREDELSREEAELVARIREMGVERFSDRFREVFTRVRQKEGFSGSLLSEDSVDDWALARDLGEYHVLVSPDMLVGHLILARACRHLGDEPRALEEVARCRELLSTERILPIERNVLVPQLEREERLLSAKKPGTCEPSDC